MQERKGAEKDDNRKDPKGKQRIDSENRKSSKKKRLIGTINNGNQS